MKQPNESTSLINLGILGALPSDGSVPPGCGVFVKDCHGGSALSPPDLTMSYQMFVQSKTLQISLFLSAFPLTCAVLTWPFDMHSLCLSSCVFFSLTLSG